MIYDTYIDCNRRIHAEFFGHHWGAASRAEAMDSGLIAKFIIPKGTIAFLYSEVLIGRGEGPQVPFLW